MDARLLRLLSDTEQAIAHARHTMAASPGKRLSRKAKLLRDELQDAQQRIEELLERQTMESDDQFDDDAFLANLALGTDAATSYASAVRDEPQPAGRAHTIGIVAALIVSLLCLWLFL